MHFFFLTFNISDRLCKNSCSNILSCNIYALLLQVKLSYNFYGGIVICIVSRSSFKRPESAIILIV